MSSRGEGCREARGRPAEGVTPVKLRGFVLPALGLARGVGPAVGLVISVVAIVAISMSIRRFWRADHSKRWHYTVLGTTVIGFMLYLIVRDLVELFG